MKKKTEEVSPAERELERKVPASTHDNFGGQHGKETALPDQIMHDAEQTKERLKEELDDCPSGKRS